MDTSLRKQAETYCHQGDSAHFSKNSKLICTITLENYRLKRPPDQYIQLQQGLVTNTSRAGTQRIILHGWVAIAAIYEILNVFHIIFWR